MSFMSGYNEAFPKPSVLPSPHSLTPILRTLVWRTLSKTSIIALVWKLDKNTQNCKRLQTVPHFKSWFPLTLVWLRTLTHVNSNHVKWKKGRIKSAELKREVERGSTFTLTLPLFYLRTKILRTFAHKNYATLEINLKCGRSLSAHV